MKIAFVAPLAAAALLAAGCTPAKKLYDGPEREGAEVVRLEGAKSYVFSVNDRRTGFSRDNSGVLFILPGTQRLIVHLDEDLGSRHGYVGQPAVFCAVAGHAYVVYPVTDPIARLWQPAIRDDATDADVPLKPCAGAELPAPVAAPAPASAEGPSSAPPVVPPAPLPSAAPAATPAPAPAPASRPPPPPGVLAPGAQARLRVAARTRSLDDAPPAKGLDAGATVTLKVVLKKDTGAWWYVTAPAGSGWVREANLELPAP